MARLIKGPPGATHPTNLYSQLGLQDNPFPIEGIINRASQDPRVNGTIFAPEIREEVIRDFEKKLLGVGNPEQRYRLGYHWAQGDLQTGRGVGKTAILLYLQRRINADWGERYFDGLFPACVLYAYPQQGMNKLEYVAIMALQELVMQGVLESVLTNLRYQVITGGDIPGEVDTVRWLTPEDGGHLLNTEWLTQHGFDLAVLNEKVVARLVTAGVESNFAQAVAINDLLGYLKTMRRDQQLGFPPPPRDVALYRKANSLFFTQALRTLKSAGFRGAYLFIDDIENMIDQMGRRERETFAKELGYLLLRGEYEAGMSRFLTIVLTTHAAAAQRLSEAWGLAGLQASLPMSLDAPNSILVPVFNMAEAKEVVKRHVDYYHEPGAPTPYHPFTEEAVELLVKRCDYHPREFLSRAHHIVERAIQDAQRIEITVSFVAACLEDTAGLIAGTDETIDVTLL